MQITEIGLVGLGNMGSAMAERWLDAGIHVHGFDLSDASRGLLESAGGTFHSSAADAMRAAPVTVLMLPDSNAVDAIAAEMQRSEGDWSGHIVIDMGSSEPLRTRQTAEQLDSLGVRFMDAPVSGGVRGVVSGTLAIMAGGDDVLINEVLPALDVLGRTVRLGDVGSGHATKALNNLISATHLWITSEAVACAKEFGIDPRTFIDVVNNSTGRSVSSEVKWPKFILTEDFSSGFSARLLAKDVKIALGMEVLGDSSSLLAPHVARLWGEAARGLDQNADHTEVATWIDDAFGNAEPS